MINVQWGKAEDERKEKNTILQNHDEYKRIFNYHHLSQQSTDIPVQKHTRYWTLGFPQPAATRIRREKRLREKTITWNSAIKVGFFSQLFIAIC